ncbi:hypothetical protein BFP72_07645 [Reichenbachiella sp. 5M10]|nr:hypothetical protein BFP72_07645 [Reichenbachiella sp. 5M10]
MELRRSGNENDNGDTLVSYKSVRYVGFSEQRLTANYDTSQWRVIENTLQHDNVELQYEPAVSLQVYDTSNVNHFVHRGSPIIDNAQLPQNVTVDHLKLIALDAMVTNNSCRLTGNSVSEQELSTAILNMVEAILDRLESNDLHSAIIELTNQL